MTIYEIDYNNVDGEGRTTFKSDINHSVGETLWFYAEGDGTVVPGKVSGRATMGGIWFARIEWESMIGFEDYKND